MITARLCTPAETGRKHAQQQSCEVWEFSSASDQDDMEAEQAALQQHILLLVSHCLHQVVCPHCAGHSPLTSCNTTCGQGVASAG